MESLFPGYIESFLENSKYNYDLVITIGGDGTFSEAVNGNMKRKKRYLLAHIPHGTTNDIGAMFGYIKDPIKNLKLLLEGKVKSVDLCKINSHFFVYVAGFGKFVKVSYSTTKNSKNMFGYGAYLLSGLKEFFNPTKLYEVTYEVEGKKNTILTSFLLISNANRIAGINNFYNEIKLDDGYFEVLICNANKRNDIINSFLSFINNKERKAPNFIKIRTNHLIVRMPNTKINWTIDGEKYNDFTYKYEISVVKNFRIMIPQKNINNLFLK